MLHESTDPAPRAERAFVALVPSDAARAGGRRGRIARVLSGSAAQFDSLQERSSLGACGAGDGRIYTITYEAEDANGNATTRQVTVTVPRAEPSPPVLATNAIRPLAAVRRAA